MLAPVESISPPTPRLHKGLCTLSRLENKKLGSFIPVVAAILHDWFKLTLVKMKYDNKNQIISQMASIVILHYGSFISEIYIYQRLYSNNIE